jgi:hypothetical protein
VLSFFPIAIVMAIVMAIVIELQIDFPSMISNFFHKLPLRLENNK